MSTTRPSARFPSNTQALAEPFLWFHIALLAAVPAIFVLSMVGLAAGDPALPAWLETVLLGIPPAALVAWLQWQRPLYPFSVWIALKPPTRLSAARLRLLTLLKQYVTGWVAVVVAVFAYVVLRQLYLVAPLAEEITPFPPALRLFGIVWAIAWFGIANLLLQQGIAAARLLLITQAQLDTTPPFAVERVSAEFTCIGKPAPALWAFADGDEAPLPEPSTAKNNSPDSNLLQQAIATLSSLSAQVPKLFTRIAAMAGDRQPDPPPQAPSSPAAEELPDAEPPAELVEALAEVLNEAVLPTIAMAATEAADEFPLATESDAAGPEDRIEDISAVTIAPPASEGIEKSAPETATEVEVAFPAVEENSLETPSPGSSAEGMSEPPAAAATEGAISVSNNPTTPPDAADDSDTIS